MRRAAQMRRTRARGGARAQERPLSLPTSGYYANADEAEMSPVYAAELVNWRPTGTHLEFRPSCEASGSAVGVQQAYPFEFGAAQNVIRIQSSSMNDNSETSYNHTFTSQVACAYLSSRAVLAGKGDDPVIYTGSSFIRGTFTTTTSVPQYNFDGVIAHHDRLFFWDKDGVLEFYYGDVGAITGPLTRFPLDRLGNITGTIVLMQTLTVDAGHGMNDVLAIMTSTGDVVIYEGLDPGDGQDWRLSARIRLAPPAGDHAFSQVGGDLWVVTTSGVVSMLDSIRSGNLSLVSQYTRAIAPDIEALLQTGVGKWQMHTSADGQVAIISYVNGGESQQFLHFFEVGAWAKADIAARWFYNLGTETYVVTTSDEICRLSRLDRTETMTAVWHSTWIRIPETRSLAWVQPSIIAGDALSLKVWVLTDHDVTDADLADAEQSVTIEPDLPGSRVALNEVIAVDAVGEAFQIRMEITAKWAKLVQIKFGLL